MNITIHRDGKNLGPYTLDEVKHRLATGSLALTDLAFVEGATEWTTLQLVPGVVGRPPALPARGSSSPAPPPFQTATRSQAPVAKEPIWKRKSCLGCLGLFIAGIVFWIILLAIWHPKHAGDFDDSEPTSHATYHDPVFGAPAVYWVFSAFACIPLLIRTFRTFTPITMTSDNPPRFEGRWADRSVYWFTGYVRGAASRSDTSVSGTVRSSGGTVKGEISSVTTVTDSFLLVDPRNQQQRSFQVSGYHTLLWENQVASVAWVIRRGQETGPYLVVINHTTGDLYYKTDDMWRIVEPHFTVFFLLNVLICLPFPFVLLLCIPWGKGLNAQIARFKRSGIQPLLRIINENAKELAYIDKS